MRRECALSVEKNLNATNIHYGNAAPINAELNYVGITSIKPCGRQPVYNMEVDRYHNFSINGGVIVHNCMDAMRYFCQTMRHKFRK